MAIIPNSLEYLNLKFGYCLGFACLPVGRGFVIWDLERLKGLSIDLRNRAENVRETQRKTG